jgi:hypothetical protein
VDILAAWFSYDPAKDLVAATLKLGNTRTLEQPPRDWGIFLLVSANATVDNQTRGTLRFSWSFPGLGRPPTTNVTFSEQSVGDHFVLLKHHATAAYARPGNLSIQIERNRLGAYGEQLRNPLADAEEFQWAPEGATSLAFNEDLARATVDYDLKALRPASNHMGDDGDPFATTASSAMPPTQREPSTGPLALILILVAFAAAHRWTFASDK